MLYWKLTLVAVIAVVVAVVTITDVISVIDVVEFEPVVALVAVTLFSYLTAMDLFLILRNSCIDTIHMTGRNVSVIYIIVNVAVTIFFFSIWTHLFYLLCFFCHFIFFYFLPYLFPLFASTSPISVCPSSYLLSNPSPSISIASSLTSFFYSI